MLLAHCHGYIDMYCVATVLSWEDASLSSRFDHKILSILSPLQSSSRDLLKTQTRSDSFYCSPCEFGRNTREIKQRVLEGCNCWKSLKTVLRETKENKPQGFKDRQLQNVASLLFQRRASKEQGGFVLLVQNSLHLATKRS